MDPRVSAAAEIARDVLAPGAQHVDNDGPIPAESFDALRRAGLFGVGREPVVLREVWRILAGGCAATTFVWVQHHLPTRLCAATANVALADEWRDALMAGSARAGVMFAHLRRQGAPVLRAVERDGGWVVTGVAPWATGWGLVDVFGVGAETDDGRIVWFLLPAAKAAALAVQTIDLAVMRATSTVAVDLGALFVPAGHVLLVQDKAAWAAVDDVNTLQPPWAALGLAEVAARSTDVTGQSFGSEVAALCDEARRLNDATLSGSADRHELLEFRGRALVDVVRVATAAVAIAGGGAMTRSHPAQRWVREAAFYLVQQQTRPIRQNTLETLSSLPW